MSSIESIGALNEYAPNRYQRTQEDVEPSQTPPEQELNVPAAKAAEQQQDQKTTIQGFQHTGKGSFIDTVF